MPVSADYCVLFCSYLPKHRLNAGQNNLKIQLIKQIARGYRNIENFYTMINLHLEGLELNYPYKTCK